MKALDYNGAAFKHLATLFPQMTPAKLKEGIFVGPQIRKLFKDTMFVTLLSATEKAAWSSFQDVVAGFLGNVKKDNYKEIVANLLTNYQKMGVNMSLKIHFLHSHLDFFPPNLGAVSDEQGKGFHQDLMATERRYQGYWDENMLGDYCWSVLRETDASAYKRKK